jgi:hypothetical protein
MKVLSGEYSEDVAVRAAINHAHIPVDTVTQMRRQRVMRP